MSIQPGHWSASQRPPNGHLVAIKIQLFRLPLGGRRRTIKRIIRMFKAKQDGSQGAPTLGQAARRRAVGISSRTDSASARQIDDGAVHFLGQPREPAAGASGRRPVLAPRPAAPRARRPAAPSKCVSRGLVARESAIVIDDKAGRPSLVAKRPASLAPAAG